MIKYLAMNEAEGVFFDTSDYILSSEKLGGHYKKSHFKQFQKVHNSSRY